MESMDQSRPSRASQEDGGAFHEERKTQGEDVKQNVFSSYLTVVSVFSSNISCTQHRILQMTLTLVPLFVFVSSPGANAFRCLKSLFSFPDLSLTNLENGS
jgi:hypothetical protein